MTSDFPTGVVAADPYPWPYDGVLDPARTALFCIDWQVDFCGPGGYVDRIGYDLSLTRAGLEPTARVLAALRECGAMIIHTREGHRPDLSDLPANKLWRSRRIDAGNYEAALKIITMQGGVFGAVAPSANLLSAIGATRAVGSA